jgi:uncharacterized repeat protein (TIGR01451 family)
MNTLYRPFYRSLFLLGLTLLATAAARADALAIQNVQVPAEPTAASGQDLRYVIVYTNSGAATIGDAVITTTIPSGTQLLAASQGVQPAGGALTWNLPPLAPGQTGSVAFLLGIDPGVAEGTLINSQATLTARSLHVVLPSNTVTTTVVPPPILTGRLALNRSAGYLGGTGIRLTPNTLGVWGSAWLIGKQQVASGFQSLFQFQMTNSGGLADSTGANGGDGLAFVIQNSSLAALGVGGYGIGYDGIQNSLAIEFDTWVNDSRFFKMPDIPNEISVQTRGTAPNSADQAYSLGRVAAVPNLKDGAVHMVNIFYQPGVLEIFVDHLTTPALVVPVDLSKVLRLSGGSAWVGFTASTGSAWSTQDILSWEFQSF